MRRTSKHRCLMWILPAAVAMWAAGTAPAGPNDLAVTLRALDSAPLDGRLAGLTREEVVIASSKGQKHVPLDRVLALDVASHGQPTLSGQPHLRLTLRGGEILVGRLAGDIEDGILLDSPDARCAAPAAGAIPVPFDAILSLVPVPAGADPCYEPKRRRATKDDDVAHVRSGDTYAGIVLAATADGFVIETDRGDVRTVSRSDLLVLHLANEPLPRPEGVRVEIETVEGARLVVGGDLALAESALVFSLHSLPDLALSVPLRRVRSLRTSAGRFVYASELEFESEFVPYYRDEDAATFVLVFKKRWYYTRVDRRPTGCPLRLGGKTFRHGFAVHARSRISIPLNGAYERFDSYFGVDDEALEVKAGGIVDARILADGEEVWQARGVRAGAKPRRVGPLDVSSVDVLVLEVDYGEELYIGDRATWGDPVLVRK